VAALLAERGVILTDETVRRWCRTFGQGDANALRRRRPRPGDTWRMRQDSDEGLTWSAAIW
jgi:transposase-like protein